MSKSHKAKNRKVAAQSNLVSVIIEQLEPRVLYSADAFGAVFEGTGFDPNLPDDTQAQLSQLVKERSTSPVNSNYDHKTDEQPAVDAAQADAQPNRLELVVIDINVADSQAFVDDILNNAAGDVQFQFATIDSAHDGIEQLDEVLSQYPALNALHIISHGGDGQLNLGNTQLSAENLAQYATTISGWADAFTDDGDILIYGCQLAATENGIQFVDALARLTEADVAASDDLTGNAEQGGDWQLEYQSGALETNIVVSDALQQQWLGILNVAPVAEDDSYSLDEGTVLTITTPSSFGAEQVITNLADQPQNTTAADLDGDGDLDLLVVSSNNHTLSWFENTDGQGTFGTENIISNSLTFIRGATAADFDGDGDLDVAAAVTGSDSVVWFENTDGLGTFGTEQLISNLVDGSASVTAADLDGDGDLDIVQAAVLGDSISWFENTDGLGSFGTEQVITVLSDGIEDVITADFDGDGDLDILSASNNDNTVSWFENTDGLGSFGAEQIISTAGVRTATAADLDGDGDLDVLVAKYWQDTVSWFENTDGLGSFGAEQTIHTEFGGVSSVVASDLDGDGDLDVVAAATDDHTVSWFENIDGLGSFGSEQEISSLSTNAIDVVTADIDGDGDQDVVSSNFGNGTVAWFENTGVTGVLHNDIDAEHDPMTAVLVTDVTDGLLVLNANGTFTYTPDGGFSGVDSFTYKANDGTVDSATVTVTLNVNSIDDETATVVNQSMTVNEGSTNTALSLTELQSTDADTDNATLIYTVGDVSNGSLTINGSAWAASTNDTFTQQDIIDGNILYSHDDSNSTSDSFSYSVEDPTGNTLAGQTFSITVTPVDDDTATVVNQSLTVALRGLPTPR